MFIRNAALMATLYLVQFVITDNSLYRGLKVHISKCVDNYMHSNTQQGTFDVQAMLPRAVHRYISMHKKRIAKPTREQCLL